MLALVFLFLILCIPAVLLCVLITQAYGKDFWTSPDAHKGGLREWWEDHTPTIDCPTEVPIGGPVKSMVCFRIDKREKKAIRLWGEAYESRPSEFEPIRGGNDWKRVQQLRLNTYSVDGRVLIPVGIVRREGGVAFVAAWVEISVE